MSAENAGRIIARFDACEPVWSCTTFHFKENRAHMRMLRPKLSTSCTCQRIHWSPRPRQRLQRALINVCVHASTPHDRWILADGSEDAGHSISRKKWAHEHMKVETRNLMYMSAHALIFRVMTAIAESIDQCACSRKHSSWSLNTVRVDRSKDARHSISRKVKHMHILKPKFTTSCTCQRLNWSTWTLKATTERIDESVCSRKHFFSKLHVKEYIPTYTYNEHKSLTHAQKVDNSVNHVEIEDLQKNRLSILFSANNMQDVRREIHWTSFNSALWNRWRQRIPWSPQRTSIKNVCLFTQALSSTTRVKENWFARDTYNEHKSLIRAQKFDISVCMSKSRNCWRIVASIRHVGWLVLNFSG